MKKTLILDTETYSDYHLVAFLDADSGKTRLFEKHDDCELDSLAIRSILKKYTIITFNGNSYDMNILALSLSGASNQRIKSLSDAIIKSKLPSWKVCKELNVPKLAIDIDHIDLIEVAPGMGSLKIYGGRLNAPKMQDLPITPESSIDASMRPLMREYCVNDLRVTAMLYSSLKSQIALREQMSEQYGMDLRSKSDAQIAETIITSELSKLTGLAYKKTTIPEGQTFRYLDPKIVSFKSKELKTIFKRILEENFVLGANGSVLIPDWLKDSQIYIGEGKYQMGIGGLHSCEKSQYVRTNANTNLWDMDVASYYPSIILQQHLAPKSMGYPFLKVYQKLVSERLFAKKKVAELSQKMSGTKSNLSEIALELNHYKTEMDTKKTAINGSFGKLGSKYSPLYAPDLLIQTTLTGQLCLLMLIESMDAIGVEIISANTDGIVLHFDKSLARKVDEVAFDWMLDTSFELERTEYKAVASKDVNNYVAVKPDGKLKLKGCFAQTGLSKNPDMSIIFTSVAMFISNGTPLEKTIHDCKDISQFITVRKVTGGAVWNGEKLGRAVRFYKSSAVPNETSIHYATNDNRVPMSAGTRPLMDLPDTFPEDIDYAWYISESEKLLCEVGG